ncbi:MAG: hypothetical protein LAP61_20415 [Acidobacteriia bacterium]|nr:hypothetical protein [Terriglobia bacterium]
MSEAELSLRETVEDFLDVIARRRWWAFAIACGITLATIGAVLSLPSRYISEALLVVVQQQVSQRYVPDSATTLAEAIQAMTRNVLSRARLSAIIDEFSLYTKEKQHLTPDALVELMRKDIDIEFLDPIPGRSDFSAFKISFTANDPYLAREVASRLTSLFIQENVKRRGEQATSTSSFLIERLEAAKQNLAEQEKRLRDVKTRNGGDLPEQQGMNLTSLAELRMQLQTTLSSTRRAQHDRTSLEASIGDRLARIQSERTALLKRFTPKYPEVVKKDQELAKTQALLDGLRAGTLGTLKWQDFGTPDELAVGQLKRQVEANVDEIENLSKEEARLRTEISQVQARLNQTPIVQDQLAAIQRDYDLYKQNYTDLLNKQLQSDLSTKLEENQEGQQFRLLDPPTLPVKPASPQRLKMSLGGTAAGILMGLVFAFVIDSRDQSFHAEKALRQAFAVPLVLSIPLLLTPAEGRARKWKRAFECLAGALVTLVVLASELYVYRHG